MSLISARKTLDISHENKSAYLNVSPDIYTDYQDVLENQLGATFTLNEDHTIDRNMLVYSSMFSALKSKNVNT